MTSSTTTSQHDPNAFKVYGVNHLDQIPEVAGLPDEVRHEMRVVATVLPFRVNRYVVEQLIRWKDVPNDPVFRITFPQREMIAPEHFERVERALEHDDREVIQRVVAEIRAELNPHPGDQQALNIPMLDGVPVEGLQHKYHETVLLFPKQGQTCHSYCSFCFRWAQFVQDKDLRMAISELDPTFDYLAAHTEATDLLVTGGDPMVMTAARLRDYLEPLLEPRFDHIQNIRIGSKSLTFWPQRFVTDKDADDTLRLFEQLVAGGKHLAFMAHYEHWREMETDIAHEAIRRIRSTGAVIRSQAPLLAHVNDDPQVWARNWETQVKLGIVPYYMFMERDTGARRYFEVPIARALEIYRDALATVSGLGRTARGPVMSTGPGKVHVQGTIEVEGRKAFLLSFLQARDPEWVGRTFLAEYDRQATWLSGLRPFGGGRFFFQDAYDRMLRPDSGSRRVENGVLLQS